MERVVVFGTGAVARDAYAHMTYESPYKVAAFTVDGDYLEEDTLCGLPVVPFEDVASIYPPDGFRMFVGVGYVRLNRLRAERCSQAKAKAYRLVSYVSPRAIVWPGAVIGENCFIYPNSQISDSARVGDDVLIGPNSIVPHNCVIGDHCFVGSSVILSGFVTIGPYCFLGTGAVVRNNIRIAGECIIGAGALILEDTEERGVYKGREAERLPISSDRLTLG